MTASDLPTLAFETGKTGGWLLQAPAAFFRRFTGKPARRISLTKSAGIGKSEHAVKTMLATQTWLVTWQNRNGDTQSNTIQLCGFWRISNIETRARDALFHQRGISAAQILRLSLDFQMTPARMDAVNSVAASQDRRMRFEQGCG